MANEYNPDLAGLGGSWLDQLGVGQYGDAYGGGYSPPTFQGFGTNPGLGGMYGGAAPATNINALGNQWLDQILGTGGGAGGLGAGNMYPNLGGNLTAPPFQGLGGYGGLQGLEQLAYNPPNMSSYPSLQAYQAPPSLMPQAQGVGGYGSALAQTSAPLSYGQFGAQQYSPQSLGQQYGGQQYGQQGLGGAQQYNQQYQQAARGRQGTGTTGAQQGSLQTQTGYGQQYGQQAQQSYGQPYQAGQTGQQYGYSGGTTNPAQTGGASQDRMPFSIPAGGVYGQQKWLPGSTGADIFLPRNTPITAKTGGKVLYATGGSAISGGADTIAQFDDGTVARFRHVQPNLQAGQQFRPGQVLAVVNDSSMDMLSRQVAAQIGAPDGFQHLDLSINSPGQTQFSPQGGGGGGLSAPQWLQSMGYQGRVVSKTPGPQEGMSGGGGLGGGQQLGGFGGLGQMGLGGFGQQGFGQQMGSYNPMSMLQGLGGMQQGGFGGGQQFGGMNLQSLLGMGQGFGQQMGGYGQQFGGGF